MKCLYDRDRKAFYIVPTTPADEDVLEDDFGYKQAGDFLLLVRQDILDSNGQMSHLEVSQFLYHQPRAFSAYEEIESAAAPDHPEPDPRGGRGTKRAGGALARTRNQSIVAFANGLPGNQGEVVILPNGTNPPDPETPGPSLRKR